MRLCVLGAALAIALVAGPLMADEVLFTNGDRLTGKIDSLDGGKLTITTKVAGQISVDMKDVKTFSTEAPLAMHLADGTVINQKVVASEEPGRVALDKGGTLQPQNVTLADVKKINPPPVTWVGSISAGALLTRGNTDTDSVNINAEASRRTEFDRITLGAGYLYGRQKEKATGEKSTTVDNWFIAGKYDYFFEPKFYAYGNARVERDRIADLDLRFTPGGGVGYQWFETAETSFFTEAGVSWVYESYTDPDVTRDHIAVRLAYHLNHKLNDKVMFFHDLEFLPSVEDMSQYLVNTQAGIRAALTQQMFTEFKIVMNYNSEPPENTEKTDLRYVVSVGWKF